MRQEVKLIETGETPMKCSSQLAMTMQQIKNHSKAFTDKKLNNFDNQVKNKEEPLYNKLTLKSPQVNKQENISTMFDSKVDFRKQVNK